MHSSGIIGHHDLARTLLDAKQTRKPVPLFSRTNAALTLVDAYEVQLIQRELEVNNGERLVGYKIGATNRSIQRMFGLEEPDCGYLTESMIMSGESRIDLDDYIHPMIEAEIAFSTTRTLSGADVTAADVLQATGSITPALEILDSRFETWSLKLVDTVSDNASCAAVVLGKPIPLRELDLPGLHVRLRVGNTIHEGMGAAVLGDPANSVAALVRLMAERGEGIPAGSLILAGSWTDAVPLTRGLRVDAAFESIGLVSVLT